MSAASCTKGVASLRRGHDAVGAAGRAAGLVAGHVAGEALPARAPHHLRRGAAGVRARHDLRFTLRRRKLLRALHPHVHCRSRFESQLGNSGRYVAGKRRLPRARPGTVPTVRGRTALEVFILFLVAFCLVFGGVLRMTCSMVLCSVFLLPLRLA